MIRIGVVGAGRIARTRHLPSIAASDAFSLAGLADPAAEDAHPSQAALFAAVPALDAVAICTPPRHRFALARAALLAGKHVLLEKPPAAGLGELAQLVALAGRRGRTLFTAWHSQHNHAVARAADLLADAEVATLDVIWREDFARYHPGQTWMWQPGGFGVFDAGINALSVLARILPGRLALRDAELWLPEGAAAPVRALLTFHGDGSLRADLDWRSGLDERREVAVTTTDGRTLLLSRSGGRLDIDGRTEIDAERAEYPMLYARFAALVAAGASEVDGEPQQMVADAWLCGRQVGVAAMAG